MRLGSKELENIFSLANQFEDFCSDKFIRLIYNIEFSTVEIEVVNLETLETLKHITYKIETQEDIEELENILEMYVQKEER